MNLMLESHLTTVLGCCFIIGVYQREVVWLTEDSGSISVQAGAEGTAHLCREDAEVARCLLVFLLHVGGAVDAGGVASVLGKTGLDPVAIIMASFCRMCPVVQPWSGPASLPDLELAGEHGGLLFGPLSQSSWSSHPLLLSSGWGSQPACRQ